MFNSQNNLKLSMKVTFAMVAKDQLSELDMSVVSAEISTIAKNVNLL